MVTDPKNYKEDAYRDTDLGIMIELHKQFTSMHKWQLKSAPTEGAQLQQHIAHMDHMVSEMGRLTPKLPTIWAYKKPISYGLLQQHNMPEILLCNRCRV